MASSRDDLSTYIARLERDLHQARCDLAAETERRQRAEARARAWKRVAEWIWAAQQRQNEGDRHD